MIGKRLKRDMSPVGSIESSDEEEVKEVESRKTVGNKRFKSLSAKAYI